MENGASIFLEEAWALNVLQSREAATTLCGTKAGAELFGGMSDTGYELVYNKTNNGRLSEERYSAGGSIAFFEGEGPGEPKDLECRQWLEAILHDKEPLVKPEQAFLFMEQHSVGKCIPVFRRRKPGNFLIAFHKIVAVGKAQ